MQESVCFGLPERVSFRGDALFSLCSQRDFGEIDEASLPRTTSQAGGNNFVYLWLMQPRESSTTGKPFYE